MCPIRRIRAGRTQFHVNRVVRRTDLASAHRMNAHLLLFRSAALPWGHRDPDLHRDACRAQEQGLERVRLRHGASAGRRRGLARRACSSAPRYFRGTLTARGRLHDLSGAGQRCPPPAAGHPCGGAGVGGWRRWRRRVRVPRRSRESAQPPAGNSSVGPCRSCPSNGHAPGPAVIPAAAATELGTKCHTEVHGIYFDFASPVIRPESEQALAGVAALLRANPTWAVTIEGHTDSVGGAKPNLDLSRLRAEAVRDALQTRFGIPASRLSDGGLRGRAAGRIQQDPRGPCAQPAGRVVAEVLSDDLDLPTLLKRRLMMTRSWPLFAFGAVLVLAACSGRRSVTERDSRSGGCRIEIIRGHRVIRRRSLRSAAGEGSGGRHRAAPRPALSVQREREPPRRRRAAPVSTRPRTSAASRWTSTGREAPSA